MNWAASSRTYRGGWNIHELLSFVREAYLSCRESRAMAPRRPALFLRVLRIQINGGVRKTFVEHLSVSCHGLHMIDIHESQVPWR